MCETSLVVIEGSYGTVQLASVGLAQARPNYKNLGCNCCLGLSYIVTDNALAGLIREIRNVSLYVQSFQLCELE